MRGLVVEIFRLSGAKLGMETGGVFDKKRIFQHFHPVLLFLEFSLRMRYFKRKSSIGAKNRCYFQRQFLC